MDGILPRWEGTRREEKDSMIDNRFALNEFQ
jgi:hypothetical protein